MGHSILKHKTKCGGFLHVDISRMFSLRSPSVTLTKEGIFIGVVELQTVSGRQGEYELTCEKCSISIPKKHFEEAVGVSCMVCRKTKGTNEVFHSTQIAAVCKECRGYLSEGNKDSVPEYIQPLLNYMRITKDMKFIPYSQLLEQNIRI